MQLDSKERLATGWAGVGDVGNVGNMLDRTGAKNSASRGESEASADDSVATTKRGWARTAFRFAKNAVIGLLLLTAVPIAVVARYDRHLTEYDLSGLRDRLVGMERLRSLESPKDASITPMQAGRAFSALQAMTANTAFPTRAVADNSDRPWKTYQLTSDMFPMRATSFNGPWEKSVVELSAGGFSKEEMAYLRTVAESKVWRDFDMVGSANSVDVIGGHYTLPFQDNASAFDRPGLRFADTKELASAGISRAAYFMAIGQPAQAEAALRSIVSFGFALMDNGTSVMDGLIGRLIVDMGRDGLNQFNTATHGSIFNSEVIEFKPFAARKLSTLLRQRVSADAYRQRLIVEATDPSLPNSLRYERLRQLSNSSCSNVREMLFGPGDDINDAFKKAATTLARYPSEAAYLELIRNSTTRLPQSDVRDSPIDRLLVGAAMVAGTVTHNSRMATCTRLDLLFQ